MNEETKLKMSESRKGIAKSDEHKEAIRNSHLGRTHEWQDKINKNPEKIRKTAEKHKGMKRSEIAKQNITNSRKKFFQENGTESIGKNKIYIINIETKKRKRHDPHIEIPEGWIKSKNANKKLGI